MQILFYVPGMPFNGDTIPSGKGLGGSETAGYYMAKELSKRGHRVTVFTTDQNSGRYDDVKYEWIGEVSQKAPLGDRYHFAMQPPCDVIVAQRHPHAFLFDTASKVNIWHLHDLALYRSFGQVQQQLRNVDKIFTVSEFHRQQVSKVYDIKDDHILATFNGLDYSQYENLPGHREEKSLFFASRPERGLVNLVGEGGIMEKLPDHKLYVCSYENTTPDMADFYKYLWDRCEQLPNVVNLGHLGKRELAERMAQSKLYVYPTTFEDTSCLMALEANACGTPFIALNIAALPETMKGAGAVLMDDKKFKPDRFVKAIVKNCEGERWEGLHQKALTKRQTWEDAAEQWETCFEDIMRKKCGNKKRLYNHLETMSDITAIQKDIAADYGGVLRSSEIEILPVNFKENYKFYLENNFKDHYKAYYEYEKNRGVDYGPESLEGEPRYMTISKCIDDAKPSSVLDYGCAHGHYVMNLSKRFPDIKFTGLDIEETNIEKARKWCRESGTKSDISFEVGDIDSGAIASKFEMVIMGEVLEHMPDPKKAVSTLLENVTDGGTMCISVPYGPWEALGYDKHKGWRAHIHHFELTDLYELFGDQPDMSVMAVPHRGMIGFGHYVVVFKKGYNPEIGCIDYERKLQQQAPRELLSVCMILKDEAINLPKCLDKLRYVADEIIIGIDQTTTDNTAEVAIGLCKQYDIPCKAFPIPSPADIGFASARNLTIKDASCDWILWIDADETLERSRNLHKYLRANSFDGYAIKQHHISADPPGVHKEDKPCRLFRNNNNVIFHGWVHEHPGQRDDMNKGVGKVVLIPDVDIMHQGYADSTIRYHRFQRNHPLMKKDRQDNPDRHLGKFLWLRDLVSLITYNLQRNGMRITDNETKLAMEACETWRDLIKSDNIRLIMESLPWYSEASKIVTNKQGLEAVIYYDVVKQPGISIINNHPDPNNIKRCHFAKKEDLKLYQDLLFKSKTENCDSKYF